MSDRMWNAVRLGEALGPILGELEAAAVRSVRDLRVAFCLRWDDNPRNADR